jgi:hypothetical protein
MIRTTLVSALFRQFDSFFGAIERTRFTITLPMRFPIFIKFLLIALNKISYCLSIYYLKAKINPKQ